MRVVSTRFGPLGLAFRKAKRRPLERERKGDGHDHHHRHLSGIGIPTGTWKIDKAHTRVGFVVRTLGVSTVRGEFRKFDGALEIGEDLDNARAYGRVDASSVDTNQAKRDTHLRSPDFLSAERHPELTLRSKAIEPVGDGIRKVHGNNHDPSRNGFSFGSNS